MRRYAARVPILKCTRWLLLVGCLTLTGCSTVTNLGGSEYELGVPARAIYGGTRLAAWEVGCCFKAMLQGYPGEEYMIIPSATVAFFDFPLSLIADTLLLPYTIHHTVSASRESGEVDRDR